MILDFLSQCVHNKKMTKNRTNLGNYRQFFGVFYLASKDSNPWLGIQIFCCFFSPAKFVKIFESLNQDSRIQRITTSNAATLNETLLFVNLPLYFR
jgi:hypothetical protein